METTYKVGIIGCGGISHMHAGWYNGYEKTEIFAAADIKTEQLDRYKEQYGVERLYTDYIEMLEKEQLDIVSVCTRPKLHAPVTIDAAKRGVKGILCEKPMAENMGQADVMMEICDANGVKLAIDHQLRFDGNYVTAKNLVAEGKIGELFRIYALCGSGDLKDNATHTVDLMLFINGDKPIEWVIGQIERIGEPKRYDLDSENFALGYMRFSDNVRGIIEVGEDTGPGYHHIYLYGTEGEIELGVPGGPGIRMRTKETDGDWIAPEHHPSGGNPVIDLVAAIEEDREHRSNGKCGRAALEFLMAVYESSRKRCRVRLPLEEKESPLTLMIKEGQI